MCDTLPTLRWTMLLSLCFGWILSSHAADDIDPAGKATISGRVDVPLYTSPNSWDPTWYVEVKVGESTALLRVATGHGELRLTDGGAKTLGVKLKGDKKKGSIDSLSIGTVTLEHVKVGPWNDKDNDPDTDGLKPLKLAGEIGLMGFPELAFAILPSQGILRLAPAADGAALVSEVGGTPLSYSMVEDDKGKVGSNPYDRHTLPLVVDANYSGMPFQTRIRTESWISTLLLDVDSPMGFSTKDHTPAPVKLPVAPSYESGTCSVQTREVVVGPLKDSLEVTRCHLGPLSLVYPPATVGADMLRMTDIAVDPVGHTLALKAVTEQKAADYGSIREAALKKKTEPAPPADGKDAPSPEDQKEARLAAIPALADWYSATSQWDKAVPLYQELVDAKPELCENWMSLGQGLEHTGQAGAADAYKKSAELYDAWAALSLTERKKLEPDYAKAKEKDQNWDGPIPQNSVCYKSWGKYARVHLSQGDYASIASVYPAKRDLDERLPIIAGNALLLKGDLLGAQAAYHQAVAMMREGSFASRLGLVLSAGNLEQVQAQLNAPGGMDMVDDPVALRLYLGRVQTLGGDAAAELNRLLLGRPESVVLLAAKAALLKSTNAAEASGLLAQAQTLTNAWLKSGINHSWWLAIDAQLHLQADDAAGAKASAEAALKLSPDNALAWLVLSDAQAQLGDAAAAAEARKKAVLFNPGHPGYALLLANK